MLRCREKDAKKSMAPMAKPRRNGGKWHVMELAHSVALKGFFDKPPPAVKKPRSGAAAPDSVPASDREDEGYDGRHDAAQGD